MPCCSISPNPHMHSLSLSLALSITRIIVVSECRAAVEPRARVRRSTPPPTETSPASFDRRSPLINLSEHQCRRLPVASPVRPSSHPRDLDGESAMLLSPSKCFNRIERAKQEHQMTNFSHGTTARCAAGHRRLLRATASHQQPSI